MIEVIVRGTEKELELLDVAEVVEQGLYHSAIPVEKSRILNRITEKHGSEEGFYKGPVFLTIEKV